jgi:MFS family permease
VEPRRRVPFVNDEEDAPRLLDVKHFPLSVWLIFAICVFFYMAVFLMIQFGGVFVQHHFGLSQGQASTIVSLPYLVSAIASPLLGFGVLCCVVLCCVVLCVCVCVCVCVCCRAHREPY